MGSFEVGDANEKTRDGIDYDPTTVNLTEVIRGENESVLEFQQRAMNIFFEDKRALFVKKDSENPNRLVVGVNKTAEEIVEERRSASVGLSTEDIEALKGVLR